MGPSREPSVMAAGAGASASDLRLGAAGEPAVPFGTGRAATGVAAAAAAGGSGAAPAALVPPTRGNPVSAGLPGAVADADADVPAWPSWAAVATALTGPGTRGSPSV